MFIELFMSILKPILNYYFKFERNLSCILLPQELPYNSFSDYNDWCKKMTFHSNFSSMESSTKVRRILFWYLVWCIYKKYFQLECCDSIFFTAKQGTWVNKYNWGLLLLDHKFNPYMYTLSTLSHLGYEISVFKEQGGIQSNHQLIRHVNRFLEEWILFFFSLAENISSVSIDPWKPQTKRKRRALMHLCGKHSKQLKAKQKYRGMLV